MHACMHARSYTHTHRKVGVVALSSVALWTFDQASLPSHPPTLPSLLHSPCPTRTLVRICFCLYACLPAKRCLCHSIFRCTRFSSPATPLSYPPRARLCRLSAPSLRNTCEEQLHSMRRAIAGILRKCSDHDRILRALYRRCYYSMVSPSLPPALSLSLSLSPPLPLSLPPSPSLSSCR